jgi:glycosyltransferase involved in cell wall biosynthesis
VTDIAFPGKLLYYMAAGTAILAAVTEDSETGRFIRENRVGMVVPPEDPAALATAIRWMREHPEQTGAFGRKGRHLIETQFDRSFVLERFGLYLEQLGVPPGNLTASLA